MRSNLRWLRTPLTLYLQQTEIDLQSNIRTKKGIPVQETVEREKFGGN